MVEAFLRSVEGELAGFVVACLTHPFHLSAPVPFPSSHVAHIQLIELQDVGMAV